MMTDEELWSRTCSYLVGCVVAVGAPLDAVIGGAPTEIRPFVSSFFGALCGIGASASPVRASTSDRDEQA